MVSCYFRKSDFIAGHKSGRSITKTAVNVTRTAVRTTKMRLRTISFLVKRRVSSFSRKLDSTITARSVVPAPRTRACSALIESGDSHGAFGEGVYRH
jgi:hypothetical protein